VQLIEANRNKKTTKFYKSSNVFNLEQAVGIEPNKIKDLYKDDNFERKDFITLEDCQKILDGVNDLKIKHFEQTRAYYDLNKDEIILPLKTQFKDSQSYYSVAFHELGHSTGHPSR
jgi:antirestriction protein ArdC